jgi:Ca2+-binding EF-hand superfamily protein
LPPKNKLLVGKCFVRKGLRGGMAEDTGSDELSIEKAIEALAGLLKQSEMTLDEIFDKIDADSDGKISGPELYNGIKDITGNNMSLGQISKIIKILDDNNDNRVDANEFKNALAKY